MDKPQLNFTLAQRAATYEAQPILKESAEALESLEYALIHARTAAHELKSSETRHHYERANKLYHTVCRSLTSAAERAALLSVARENCPTATAADLDMILTRALAPLERMKARAADIANECSELQEEVIARMGRIYCLVRLQDGQLNIFTEDDSTASSAEIKIALGSAAITLLNCSDVTILERVAINNGEEIGIGIDSSIIVAFYPSMDWDKAR